MAIIPSSKYPAQIDTSDSDGYPYGKAQNVSTAGDGTGTPLEKDWVNDLWGFLQALLDRAGITPSTNPDKVGDSDYLDAIDGMFGGGGRGLVRTDYELINAGYDDSTHTSNNVESVAYNDDGTRIFILKDDGTSYITQANLSTPYDLSTASEQGALNINTNTPSPRSIKWKADGTRFWVLDDSGSGSIQQYNCSTAWQTTSGVTFDVSWTIGTVCEDFEIYQSGTRMVTAESGIGTIIQEYTLSAAYDLNTSPTTSGSDPVNYHDINANSIKWVTLRPDDKYWYAGMQHTTTLYYAFYEGALVGTISSAGNTGNASAGRSRITSAYHDYWTQSGQFSGDGSRFIIVDTDKTTIRQLHTSTMRLL